MADIDRVTELLERVPEAELQRRYKFGCLAQDLAEAERALAVASSALIEVLRLNPYSMSQATRDLTAEAIAAKARRDAARAALRRFHEEHEPKCGAV